MKFKTCLAQVTQQKFANLKKINRLKLCETFDKPFKNVILWIGKFVNVSLCKFFQVLSKPTVIIFYEAIRIYKSSVDAWKIKKLTQNPLDKLISRVIRARNEPANSLLYTAHTVGIRAPLLRLSNVYSRQLRTVANLPRERVSAREANASAHESERSTHPRAARNRGANCRDFPSRGQPSVSGLATNIRLSRPRTFPPSHTRRRILASAQAQPVISRACL